MKLVKKYAGVWLALVLCVALSLTVMLPAAADLVAPPDGGSFGVDDGLNSTDTTTSEDVDDTPSAEDPITSTEDTSSDDTTGGDESDASTDLTDSNDPQDESSQEPWDDESDASTDYGSDDPDEDDTPHGGNDTPTGPYGNGEDITGNAGSGSDVWGADYSEGKVVSKASGSASKKNIADYQGKMMKLIWIPIVLIVLAAGTLIGTNLYFAKKKRTNPKNTDRKFGGKR